MPSDYLCKSIKSQSNWLDTSPRFFRDLVFFGAGEGQQVWSGFSPSSSCYIEGSKVNMKGWINRTGIGFTVCFGPFSGGRRLCRCNQWSHFDLNRTIGLRSQSGFWNLYKCWRKFDREEILEEENTFVFFAATKKKKKEFQYFIFGTWIFLAAGMGSKPVFCNEFDAQTGDQPYELYAFMCDPLSPKHRCGFVESLKLGNKLRQRVNVNPLFSTAELKNTKKKHQRFQTDHYFPAQQ